MFNLKFKQMKAILVVALIFFYSTGSVLAADYIVVDRPQQLRILNHYEQNIGSTELYSLPAFIPLKIIENDVMLSDQFTRAMQVSFAGKEYFLVKDGLGQLINQSPESKYQLFRNVTEYRNPVRVLAGKSIEVQFPGPGIEEKSLLTEGLELYPVFRSGSKIYVNISDARARFGWVNSDATGNWARIDPDQPPPVIRNDYHITTDIINLTERINGLYARIFADLSDASGRHYPAPAWKVEETSGSIRLSFMPAEYGEQFRESIALMKTEIGILIRTSNRVIADTQDPLIIEINEKENN